MACIAAEVCVSVCECVSYSARAACQRFSMCVALILYSVHFEISDRDIPLDVCRFRILSQIFIWYAQSSMQSGSFGPLPRSLKEVFLRGWHKVSWWTWLVNPLRTEHIGNGGRCNHGCCDEERRCLPEFDGDLFEVDFNPSTNSNVKWKTLSLPDR